MNPLSMMEVGFAHHYFVVNSILFFFFDQALVGAMQHSAKLRPGKFDSLIHFSKKLQSAIHAQMVEKVEGQKKEKKVEEA